MSENTEWPSPCARCGKLHSPVLKAAKESLACTGASRLFVSSSVTAADSETTLQLYPQQVRGAWRGAITWRSRRQYILFTPRAAEGLCIQIVALARERERERGAKSQANDQTALWQWTCRTVYLCTLTQPCLCRRFYRGLLFCIKQDQEGLRRQFAGREEVLVGNAGWNGILSIPTSCIPGFSELWLL